MDVHVGFLEQGDVEAKLGCARFRQGQRRLRAFLHHLAKLAGEDELAASRNPRRLDEKNVAAGRRPGEAGGDAGQAGAHGDFVLEAPRPENGRECRAVDPHALGAGLRDPHGDVPAHSADQPFQIAHTRFARVVADHHPDRVLGDLAPFGGKPIRVELALEQIAPGDFQLLVLGVAGELNHLHAVAHRAGNGVEHVGGGDEHHPRQVESDAEIIVAERRILLGVQHFEQRRGRIALKARAELVDLVEHHHRVARSRLADRLDDVAR